MSDETQTASRSEIVSIFVSILPLLVENDVVDASDLGKIAQVCKTIKHSTMNNDIWAALCTRNYPDTHRFSSDFKEYKGYREIYKSWCVPIAKRPRLEELPALATPSCPAEKIRISTNIVYNGKAIWTSGWFPSDMGCLLKTGGDRLKLHDPTILGEAEWNFTEEERVAYSATPSDQGGLPVTCHSFDDEKLEVSIHIFRSGDDASMCVFRSRDRQRGRSSLLVHPCVDNGGNIRNNAKFDLVREQRYGGLHFNRLSTIEQLPYKDTSDALEVMRRLPYPVHFGATLVFGVVGNGDLAVTAVDLYAMWKDPITDRLGFYNSVEEAKKHGVTLLHILSNLNG